MIVGTVCSRSFEATNRNSNQTGCWGEMPRGQTSLPAEWPARVIPIRSTFTSAVIFAPPNTPRHESGKTWRGDRPHLPASSEIRARRKPCWSSRLFDLARVPRRADFIFLRRHAQRCAGAQASKLMGMSTPPTVDYEPDPMAKRGFGTRRAYYKIPDRRFRKRIFRRQSPWPRASGPGLTRSACGTSERGAGRS